MIDPLISLASAIQSGPGRYALLLGSGVSRAAGMPSGWEVVLDLAEQVAQLESANTGGDPEGWYRERFGMEPNYAELLAGLASTQADRAALLRRYFEPTDDEREQGLKVPTAAHSAIADLVRDGYIRVIVTTNFDRLLETSLEDAGVAPVVIASADAAEGALPLVHNPCTVVKIHGDYRDARIRNTPDELAAYEPALDRLLDRVLDEYGLVVCGWSADYDTALGDAILRCPSRRFQTYWAARGDIGQHARELLDHRDGEVVRITDADTFFVSLAEKVSALAQLRAASPASADVAVATLKRYLPEERNRIRLHDFLADEIDRLATAAAAPDLVGVRPATTEELIAILERYEATSETVMRLMVTLGYWAEPHQRHLIVDGLERLYRRSAGREVGLDDYPTLLASYAAGLGALGRENYETLANVLGVVQLPPRFGEPRHLVYDLAPNSVVPEDLLQGEPRRYTPVQNRIYEILRPPTREAIPGDDDYERLYDRFELLLAVASADITRDRGGLEPWGPPGRWAWKRHRPTIEDATAWARAKVDELGEAWPFLRGPLFDGSPERFRAALEAMTGLANRLHWH